VSHYGAKDLASSFRTVRKNTIQVAQDIPEDKYGFRPAPETRSVTELLSHIALAHRFQHQIHAVEKRTTLDGFDFFSLVRRLHEEEKAPRSKAQTIEMLQSSGEKWAGWLDGLSDDFLAERVQMPHGADPATRGRLDMILSVKEHEMHHRGQLMLIQRLVGVVPHLTRQMQERMAAATAKK
jgi:uncharacterized damage-inducible protein DinB